jgi:capsular exopolysaccharide synthesis family protein
MSKIFDALQRWDAERTGTSSPMRPTATELLERAERHATAQWSHEQSAKSSDNEGQLEWSSPQSRDISPAGAEPGVATPGNDSGLPPQHRFLSQFGTLDLALTGESRLVAVEAPESAAAEAFRLLAVRLRHIQRDRALRTVLITSTVPQEGKTMVAANLAYTLAGSGGKSVLLIDGDFRRPALTKWLALDAVPGLCEWAQGTSTITTSIHRLGKCGPWVLTAGGIGENRSELIESTKLPQLLEQISGYFNWVIIDSPPVLPLADTSMWARLADGILLVARRGVTEKRHLLRGLESLAPDKLIGVVMNAATTIPARHYAYYYGKRPADSAALAVDNS